MNGKGKTQSQRKQEQMNLEAAQRAGEGKAKPTLGDVAGEAFKSITPAPAPAKDPLAIPDMSKLDSLVEEAEKDQEQTEKIAAYKASIEALTVKLVAVAKAMGRLLHDTDNLDFNWEKVSQMKSVIEVQISGITIPGEKKKSATAVFQALVESLPKSDLGVKFLTEYVTKTNLLRSVKHAAAGSSQVTYTEIVGEGEEMRERRIYLDLAPVFGVDKEVEEAFKRFAGELVKKHLQEERKVKAEHRRNTSRLFAGTEGNLLEVLRDESKKTVDAVTSAFDMKDKVSGLLRVKVDKEAGAISVVGATGKYEPLADEMVKYGTKIPLYSLEMPRLQIKGAQYPQEEWDLMVRLHRALTHSLKVLVMGEEFLGRAKKMKGYVSPSAFVLDKTPGVTHLFQSKLFLQEGGRPLHNIHAIVERRKEDGFVAIVEIDERNAEAFQGFVKRYTPISREKWGNPLERLLNTQAQSFEKAKTERKQRKERRKAFAAPAAKELAKPAEASTVVETASAPQETVEMTDPKSSSGE